MLERLEARSLTDVVVLPGVDERRRACEEDEEGDECGTGGVHARVVGYGKYEMGYGGGEGTTRPLEKFKLKPRRPCPSLSRTQVNGTADRLDLSVHCQSS